MKSANSPMWLALIGAVILFIFMSLWLNFGFFIALLIYFGFFAFLGISIAIFMEISKSISLKKQQASYLKQYKDICTSWYNNWNTMDNKQSSYQNIELWRSSKTWKTELTINYVYNSFTQTNPIEFSSVFNSFSKMIDTRKGLEYTVSVVYGDEYLIAADSSDYEDYENDRCLISIRIKKKGW